MLIQRYIAVTIAQTIGLVVLALLGLETFILFIGQLGDLGGQYDLIKAFEYVLLYLPLKLYSLFPMAGLLGMLLGLGLMAGHSELIVMRAAGISLGQITMMVLKITLLLLIIVTVTGETLAPTAGHLAENIKQTATSDGQVMSTSQGLWLRDGDYFIHIQGILSGDHIEGISRYQFDNQHHLLTASYAKVAHYQQSHWVLKDVVESQLTHNQVRSSTVAQTIIDMPLNPNVLRTVGREPETMSLLQLYQTLVYRSHSGLQAGTYGLIFWKRVFQPLAMVVMMLLSIPFIFGPLRTVTMGLRIVTGVVVGFSFHIANEFFGPMGLVLQVPPFFAVLLPILLFAMIGVWLLRRVR